MSVVKSQTNQYFNENVYFHNNLSIQDYLKNKRVPLGLRAGILFSYFYSNPKNKGKSPEDRIIIQNPELLRQLGYNIPQESYNSKEYEQYISAIQSALERYEADGFWTRQFKTKENTWVDLYITDSQGNRMHNPESFGLTERRIILNVNKLKQLLSTLPDEANNNDIKARSRAKRMLLSRPVTLVDYLIKDLTNTTATDAVNRVQNRRRVINKYIQKQAKKYGDFSVMTNPSDIELEIKKEALNLILDYINLDPGVLIQKLNNNVQN